jgi:hypothetical protein
MSANSVTEWTPWIDYSLQIHSKKILGIDWFQDFIKSTIWWKEIISFWEEHNLNQDNSFQEVLNYSDIIFHIYRRVKIEKISFNKVLTELRGYMEQIWDSRFDAFIEFSIGIIDNQQALDYSSSRYFASLILPLCRKEWFTHLIFEWFDERNPENTYKLSKDKIWFLMILLSSMLIWIHINGAYDSTPLFWPLKIAEAFKTRIQEIKQQNPTARIFTYNGWVHNMTDPIKGEYKILWMNIDLENLTFAPYFMWTYWDNYLSVDLVDQFWEVDSTNHFNYLKGLWHQTDITLIEHSKWQLAIVMPLKKKPTASSEVAQILEK